MTFNGADEYFAYQGLKDGYEEVMTEEEMYEYVLSWPLPGLKCRKDTEDAYIFGFLLGREIKESEREEKEQRQKEAERRRRTISDRESVSDLH